MHRLTLALMIVTCLLVAACGGNGDANNAPPEDKYVPDVSTPEGATEAFARSIETGNISLFSIVVHDAEREALVPEYTHNFEQSKKQGVEWKIEVIKTEIEPDKEARALFKYIGMKNGKQDSVQEVWTVFLKTEDGSWKFSRAASRWWATEKKRIEEEGKKPADGGETPSDGNAPSDG